MTSKIFFCSKQKAMRLAKEVLKDMKLGKNFVDSSTSTIVASQNRRFLAQRRQMEIQLFADDHKVEIAVSVQSRIRALDFGISEYMEEEFLHRMRERIN